MDITPLTDRLDELISIVRFEGEGGRVLVPERPVDMDPLVDPMYPDYDPDTWDPMWLTFNDDAGVTMALHLNWADEAPISWDAYVECLVLAGRAYLLVPPDADIGREWQAIAVIEPADAITAWEAFVGDLLTSGGMSYGVEMFYEWPTDLWNHLPDLIKQEAIDRAQVTFAANQEQLS